MNVTAFHFSAQSKQAVMEGLAVAIQQQQITFPDGLIVQELETFEYVYSRTGVKYAALEGLHDDCVCALALAVQQWRQQQAWTLTMWSAEPAVPQTPGELEAEQHRRHQRAQEAVTDALMQGGDLWFRGGRS